MFLAMNNNIQYFLDLYSSVVLGKFQLNSFQQKNIFMFNYG